MTLVKSENRYLHARDGWWHYVRRVPSDLAGLDRRGMVRRSLKTEDRAVARVRRDGFEEADDVYWASLRTGSMTGEAAYRAAQQRALGFGVTYREAPELARTAPLEELLRRIEMLERMKGPSSMDVAALLGGVEKPRPTMSELLDVYFNTLTADVRRMKSRKQYRVWKNGRALAVNNFIDAVSDKRVDKISREDATKFFNWLRKRVDAGKVTPNAANKNLSGLRVILNEYAKHVGIDDYVNPFRRLWFKDKHVNQRPPFETGWIVERILAPGVFKGLNNDARDIMFALIETGARPSEIANLDEESIVLNGDIPHIKIRPRERLEIKSTSSIRTIPLVGVSLAAMKRHRKGFPRYFDKGNALSQLLMKRFKERGLLPTDKHAIYSLRHSWEKRAIEAGLDYGFRCRMMGHVTDRPKYGDGGSLKFQRDELLKMALPFDPAVFE